MTDLQEPLTEEQLENWRRVLSIQFGSYARIMSDEEIQKMRTEMQEEVNKAVDDEV